MMMMVIDDDDDDGDEDDDAFDYVVVMHQLCIFYEAYSKPEIFRYI